jgi:photosystem II stability/assembly factor-like uncharacterized protein
MSHSMAGRICVDGLARTAGDIRWIFPLMGLLAALWAFLACCLVQPARAGDAAPHQGLRPAMMAPLAAKSLLLGGTRAGDRLVAAGDRGHILLSDDHGATWRQVPVPADAALTAVYFPDTKNGWAVGHDSVILHSIDGGESWTLQFSDPGLEQPLMDVFFSDARKGIAVGAYGLYLETVDGGKSWERRTIDDDKADLHLNAITPLAPGVLLIAGEAGGAWLSANNGVDWTPLHPPYPGSFFDAVALGPSSFLLMGLQGAVLRTEDGGKNWTEIKTGASTVLMGGARLADDSVILVGSQGAVLRSTDQGRNFALQRRTDRAALADVVQAANGRVIGLGDAGILPLDP